MKNILLLFLFFFIPNLLLCQTNNDKTIYLDSLWEETANSDFKYIRIIKDYYLDREIYNILDYYKSGIIKRTGISETKDRLIKTGEFISYYENGNRKSIVNYRKNKDFGNCFEFYEDGNKKLDAEYIEGKEKNTTELKIIQFWNSKNIQTVIDGNGDYEEIREEFFAKGKIKNGFKEGSWEGYDKKIGYTFNENFKDQKLISGVSIDSNKVEHLYTVLEIRPTPDKGINDFYKHIGKTFRVPNIRGLKGIVYVKFIIETNGTAQEIKVLKDIGYGTGEEAIRAVSSYKDWKPGEQRGIKVRCKYSLPITIQFQH